MPPDQTPLNDHRKGTLPNYTANKEKGSVPRKGIDTFVTSPMRPLSIIILPLLLLFFSLPGRGQKHYLNTGAGWSWFKTRDQAMSPMLYRGHTLLAGLGYERDGVKSLFRTDLYFRYGSLKPRNNPDLTQANALLIKPDLDVHYLRALGWVTKWNIEAFAGLSWQTYATYKEHSRFVNNSINHEFCSSLGITGALRKEVPLFQHPLELNLQLSIPVTGYVIRPSFASSLPEGFLGNYDNQVGTYFKSGSMETWGNFWRINTQWFLDYGLKNGNKVRLTYFWDLYRHGPVNEVIAANHGFLLTTNFQF